MTLKEEQRRLFFSALYSTREMSMEQVIQRLADLEQLVLIQRRKTQALLVRKGGKDVSNS